MQSYSTILNTAKKNFNQIGRCNCFEAIRGKTFVAINLYICNIRFEELKTFLFERIDPRHTVNVMRQQFAYRCMLV